MHNLSRLIKKKEKKDDGLVIVGLILFVIFFVGKAIVESGYLYYYILYFIIGMVIYFIFKIKEKNKQGKAISLGSYYLKKYPIIIQYAPPKGINPAEAGLLYNGEVEPTDLTSLIYQWKFEGLIDIQIVTGKNSNKEYVKLIKKGDLPLTRPLFESEIFDSIFCVGNIKIIEGAFQLRYALMLEDLEYHGIKKGWIYKNDRMKNIKISEKSFFVGLYRMLYIIFYIIMTTTEKFFNLSGFKWSLIIFGCLILGFVLFCGYMDGGGKIRYTDKGAQLASHIIGYRNFIKSCDENKIKLLLKEDPLFIDRTLPYATAFGLETEFIKKVSPLKQDRNARYFRGEKVPNLSMLRFLFGSGDDNSLL